MDEQALTKLIEETIAKVLAERCGCDAADDGKDKILVIGDLDKVPEKLCMDCTLRGISDYEPTRNILPYAKVIITGLTMLQLTDIALGRPTDTVCCAVLNALLEGKPVLLMEEGLPHRKYSGRGSTALYTLLESYVRKLQGFGVKSYTVGRLTEREPLPTHPPKYQAPVISAPRGNAQPNFEMLITEVMARKMQADANGQIHLNKAAIVTPAAKDVFRVAGIEVVKDL